MATYEERLASFQPKRQKSSKRTAVNASLAKGWPHPSSFKATPSSLAHAGFYFDPTADKSDNVTCFTCEHSLGAWTASDDPFVEHLNVDAKCCWAVARCNIEFDRQKDGTFLFTAAARLPTTKAMEKARADTFKGFWIHDQTKGHTANSRKMARAGWIFNPGPGEDSDIATCFYCGKSLDGWEEGDDPTHEHRTRVPTCAVFTGKVTEQRSLPTEEVATSSTSTKQAPPVSKASSTRSKATTKRDKTSTTVTSEHHDTATESDAPSQSKRARSKKSATTTISTQPEIAPSINESSVASSSKPALTKESKPTRTKSSRSTSVARVVEDEPPELTKFLRGPSPDLKPKKGKAAKKSGKATTGAKSNSGRASPSNSIVMSDAHEGSVAVSGQEDEDVATKTTGKKKSSKKKSKAPSIVEDVGDELMEVEPEPVINDPDVTPMPPSRVTMDSLGGWESFQAANMELEELARELHIEGEFAAIGRKPSASSKTGRPIKSGSATLKPPSKQRVPLAAEEPQPDLWAWREREKSVGAKSVVTEMTEEEEVEKSLAGDDIDDEEEEVHEVEEPMLPPPRSRAPSTTSRAQSTSASTTVSSKTKAQVREMKDSEKSKGAPADGRIQVLQDEEMADGETPKASRTKATGVGVRPGSSIPSRPPLAFPTASFDIDMNGSNPFLVARNPGSGGSRSGLDSLMAQLDAPLITRDVDTRVLTEEEREMTLEEWIRYDVERRKELIRKEGRKWIETFLESAEGMREKIRAM